MKACKLCERYDEHHNRKLSMNGGNSTNNIDGTNGDLDSVNSDSNISTDTNGVGYCNHLIPSAAAVAAVASENIAAAAAAAAAAANWASFGLLPAHLRDMFLAAHLLRGETIKSQFVLFTF